VQRAGHQKFSEDIVLIVNVPAGISEFAEMSAISENDGKVFSGNRLVIPTLTDGAFVAISSRRDSED
jgi:hypothetical protein